MVLARVRGKDGCWGVLGEAHRATTSEGQDGDRGVSDRALRPSERDRHSDSLRTYPLYLTPPSPPDLCLSSSSRLSRIRIASSSSRFLSASFSRSSRSNRASISASVSSRSFGSAPSPSSFFDDLSFFDDFLDDLLLRFDDFDFFLDDRRRSSSESESDPLDESESECRRDFFLDDDLRRRRSSSESDPDEEDDRRRRGGDALRAAENGRSRDQTDPQMAIGYSC